SQRPRSCGRLLAQSKSPLILFQICSPRPGTFSIGRLELWVHSASEVGYSRTFLTPAISDNANQSVAAQWPVLQNEMVSALGLSSSLLALSRAFSGDTKTDVPGLNHLPFSRLIAPLMVPGTAAVGAFTLP